MEHTGAFAGRIYLLRPGSSELQPFASIPEGAEHHGRTVDAEKAHVPHGRLGTLEAFLDGASGARGTPRHDEGTVIYACRKGSCIGAIRLDGPVPHAIDANIREDLVATADLLVAIYEERFALDLLAAIQEPIDFTQSSEEFFRDIALLIAQSSGMEFAALREHDGNRLRCIALYGFDDLEFERSAWDLSPIEDFPPFRDALEGATVAIRNANSRQDSSLAAVQAQPWSMAIGSFVAVPVHVGTTTFGVLSVASRSRFDYAPLELRGFESIANGVGVAITNFRNSRDLATQITNQTEAAVAITGIEVARFARHEAIGYVDNANIRVHQLKGQLPRSPASLRQHVDGLENDLGSLSAAIEKIRLVTKAPKDEWALVPLRRLWDEACNAVSGRLHAEKIVYDWRGPNDLQVWAVPDRLRHVLLNLLLNSVDAFKEARARGRRIDVSVERPPDRASHVVITYRDNATGINPARLRVPPEYGDDPVAQQVFGAAVTSKDEGSGYGLWLARKIATEHGGSIDLTDYRNGVTFVMRLPKPDATQLRKAATT
jgi:signal transduction histidine kinase